MDKIHYDKIKDKLESFTLVTIIKGKAKLFGVFEYSDHLKNGNISLFEVVKRPTIAITK